MDDNLWGPLWGGAGGVLECESWGVRRGERRVKRGFPVVGSYCRGRMGGGSEVVSLRSASPPQKSRVLHFVIITVVQELSQTNFWLCSSLFCCGVTTGLANFFWIGSFQAQDLISFEKTWEGCLMLRTCWHSLNNFVCGLFVRGKMFGKCLKRVSHFD